MNKASNANKVNKEVPSKRGKKGIVIAVIVILIVAALGAYFIFSKKSESSSSGGDAGYQAPAWNPIEVTGESLPSQLDDFSAVQDLPKSAVLGLRVGDYEYTIEKNSIEPGMPENPDAVITLPEKYFEIMGQNGWCTALAIANSNKDVGIEVYSGEVELAWKYRNMLKYKVCLG